MRETTFQWLENGEWGPRRSRPPGPTAHPIAGLCYSAHACYSGRLGDRATVGAGAGWSGECRACRAGSCSVGWLWSARLQLLTRDSARLSRELGSLGTGHGRPRSVNCATRRARDTAERDILDGASGGAAPSPYCRSLELYARLKRRKRRSRRACEHVTSAVNKKPHAEELEELETILRLDHTVAAPAPQPPALRPSGSDSPPRFALPRHR